MDIDLLHCLVLLLLTELLIYSSELSELSVFCWHADCWHDPLHAQERVLTISCCVLLYLRELQMPNGQKRKKNKNQEKGEEKT